jgi:hypothetical protein
MKSFKETIYFHREKEDNWGIRDKAEELGFKCDKQLSYLGYDVEMEIEIFEDGSNKVLKIDGKDISMLDISV